MKKILVTGANGQLGKELRDIVSNFPAYEFLFLSREDLPIHHFELVRNTFDSFKPNYCIKSQETDSLKHPIFMAPFISYQKISLS